MTVNSYFNHIRHPAEQKLYEDLVIENIQITGMNFWYIPREDLRIDSILGEPVKTSFNSSYEIEGFFKDGMGFAGQGDFLSKLGVTANDVMDLIISKKRFETINVTGRPRPREGDLIYFGDPLNGADGYGSMVNSLFEITFVETETPFWQLGKQHVYTLKCQMFTYNYEKFNTGVTSVDTLTNLKVKSVKITNQGSGYAVAPIVTFTAAPTGGTTAAGTAVISGGKVTEITMTNTGNGYIFGPEVSFTPGVPGALGSGAAGVSVTDICDAELSHGINDGVKEQEPTLMDWTELNPFGAM